MSFKKSNIHLSETKQFSKLMLDYISGNESLTKFYTYKPTIESFEKAIADKSKEPINRSVLVEVLKEQYQKSGIQFSESIAELLLNENTYTVCTGHQLCLFTGPMYFIYKIITTINLAESLKKKYPNCNFVPVYWMATEDHDFEEISSINLFGRKITWNNPDAKGAVGNLNTQSLNSVIDELTQITGDSENSRVLIELFKDAYIKHATVADATRCLVNKLFESTGLVIIDPDDARLKNEFSEIMKDDLLNATNHKLVVESISELEKINVKAQVNPREINCFYMINNIRERIEFIEDKAIYKVLNTEISFTKEELLIELEQHPERFSPNVVLRPLYQQKILPNLAYVGGPGEIAYWLEYKAMFDHHKINFPVLMPRNFALLLDEKSNEQIKKSGFTINDFFTESEELIKDYVKKNSSAALSLQEEQDKLSEVYAEIATKVSAVDASLKGSVEAELQKSLNALKNIESKLMRAEKQKQETGINQIKKIRDKFLPEGVLQERYENMIPYYLKFGKELIPALKEQFDPFEFEFSILIN